MITKKQPAPPRAYQQTSEHKQENLSAKALKKVEEFSLKILGDYFPVNFYWMDCQGILLGCNENTLKRLGLKDLSEFIGRHSVDLVTKEAWENSQKAMETGEALWVEEVQVLPNTDQITYLSLKAPILNDQEEVIGLLGMSIDVTERKKIEKELQELKEREAHFRALSSLGNMIAHEMRTPLRAIDNGISGIKEYLPKLIEGYEKAKTEKLNVPFIHPMHYQALIANSENLGIEVRQAFLVIDMLLMKAKQQKMDPAQFKTHSMSEVVKTALERYPFTPEERAIVHVDISKDFNFKGDELALVHVFFNLLKNALHYIKSVNKGEVYITTTLSGKFNELHFKDTGPGISKENLEKLFDAFFTSGNAHGTGLGLAFCKMVMQGLGGDIACDSVEGEYTEFMLRFPT